MYFGTPEIAVPPLRALAAAGFDVALVVTGADKRRGRRGAPTPTPVKAAALELGGEVRMASRLGGGSEVVLDLPVARRGEQVVLVRVGSALLAVPAVAVRRIETLAGVTVEESGGRLMAILGDRLVPF